MTKPKAVIEIGSTGIRLLVAQLNDNKQWEVIDSSEFPISLGRDVFTTGAISKENILLCVDILLRFKEQLLSWTITPEQTTVLATTVFREARNPDPVLDRIYIKTGFKIKIIDGIEENLLIYLAVIDKIKALSSKKINDDAMILKVGGGSTELMLTKHGKIAGAHSLHLGTIRTEQNLNLPSITQNDIRRYIRQFILNTKGSLSEEVELSSIKYLYSIGFEQKIVATSCGKKLCSNIWEISKKDYEKFVKEIYSFSTEEIVAKYKIEYSEAQQFFIALFIYEMFIQLTNIEKILVIDTNLRDGELLSKLSEPSSELYRDFNSQISASAINLLNKYHGDIDHALYVRDVSLLLFDTLQEEIGLDERSRHLLDVASILHDIGTFVSMADHHLHSMYIISNSEIFGLKKSDINIIAQIAKYHRGSSSPQDDDQFLMLPHFDRMIILKLTAILRIADALDRSHQQKFKELIITKQNNTLWLSDNSEHSVILEQQALTEKANIFEYVFGYKIILS